MPRLPPEMLSDLEMAALAREEVRPAGASGVPRKTRCRQPPCCRRIRTTAAICFLEVRAGTGRGGGAVCQRFAAHASALRRIPALENRDRVDVRVRTGGVKEAVVRISATAPCPGSSSRRSPVKRVPVTETQGRIHHWPAPWR